MRCFTRRLESVRDGGGLDVLELTPGVDLLHSMRSVGYSFETAVADIVDNSITAGATQVHVTVDVVDGRWVTIRDDGQGMSRSEAMEALRLAGTARTEGGSTSSLGRFGLGLKTASLSQGRRVDVITRQGDELIGLAWDIDTVAVAGKWVVEVLPDDRMQANDPDVSIPGSGSGTVVVWSKLDYLLGKASGVSAHLAEKVDSLRHHLGFVFHRFLESRGGLRIVLNGSQVEAVDPFLKSHPKTQRTPQQRLDIQGFPVTLQGFTLPHGKDLSDSMRSRPDLGGSLREAQGFYIYRNQRLISHGGWLGIKPKEELTKQARVQVDITDGLDYLWQVDIRKARSEPPAEFKIKVRPLMERLILRSERLHTHRERRVAEVVYEHYWNKFTRERGVRFEVNLNHPAVRSLMAALPEKEKGLFRSLLEDLAEFFPYYDTYVAAAKSELPEQSQIDEAKIRSKLASLRDSGFTRLEVAEFIDGAEPFRGVPEVSALMKEIWPDATA